MQLCIYIHFCVCMCVCVYLPNSNSPTALAIVHNRKCCWDTLPMLSMNLSPAIRLYVCLCNFYVYAFVVVKRLNTNRSLKIMSSLSCAPFLHSRHCFVFAVNPYFCRILLLLFVWLRLLLATVPQNCVYFAFFFNLVYSSVPTLFLTMSLC